jgi:DNA-binding NtrC family response regulator
LESLQFHSWPGNVRELENVIRKALLLAQDYTINANHVQSAMNKDTGLADSANRPLGEYLDELLAAAQRGESTDIHARVMEFTERELFQRAIALAHGNQAKAARWLGISRITIKAKLVQFGLHPKSESDSGSNQG